MDQDELQILVIHDPELLVVGDEVLLEQLVETEIELLVETQIEHLVEQQTELLEVDQSHFEILEVALQGPPGPSPMFTNGFFVAALPATAPEGSTTFALNGRKANESTVVGTGVPVYFSNGAWRTYGSDVVTVS